MKRGAVLGFECGGILAAAALVLALPASAAAQVHRPVSGRSRSRKTSRRSCSARASRCHRPGEIGADVADDVRRCAAVGARRSRRASRRARCRRGTSTKRSASQQFKNDPSLSDEEIATIVKWVDAGAPRGNPADMPPLPPVRRHRRPGRLARRTSSSSSRRTRCRRPVPTSYGNLYARHSDQRRPLHQGDPDPRRSTPASRKVVHHALSYRGRRADDRT